MIYFFATKSEADPALIFWSSYNDELKYCYRLLKRRPKFNSIFDCKI